VVQKRLDIFFHETIHLLDYYGNERKLVKVNGDQDANNVQEDIIKALHDGNAQNS
jgi:adenylate kinase